MPGCLNRPVAVLNPVSACPTTADHTMPTADRIRPSAPDALAHPLWSAAGAALGAKLEGTVEGLLTISIVLSSATSAPGPDRTFDR